MKLINEKHRKFVRILIGECETGQKGIKAPIKTISIADSSVNEIYNKLLKYFNDNETKN